MTIQIIDNKEIPAGYTYTRCDRFTSSEFMEMYKDKDGTISEGCLEYMTANPKEYYTVDDRIAIREAAKIHDVGSLCALTGRNTTKRYAYDRDRWKF